MKGLNRTWTITLSGWDPFLEDFFGLARDWVDDNVLANSSLLWKDCCYLDECWVLRYAREDEELRVDFYSLNKGSRVSGWGDYDCHYSLGIERLMLYEGASLYGFCLSFNFSFFLFFKSIFKSWMLGASWS